MSVTLPPSETRESCSEYSACSCRNPSSVGSPSTRSYSLAALISSSRFSSRDSASTVFSVSSSLRYPDSSRTAPINSAGGTSRAATRHPSKSSRKAATALLRGPRQVGPVRLGQRLVEGDPVAPGVLLQPPDRGRPEAPLGDVDDPLQGPGVAGVRDHRQVRHGVLDLRPLVEPDAADDLVRNPFPHQHVLERPALRVGPVEDRDVPRRAPAVHETLDLGDHVPRLGVLVNRGEHPDALALWPRRPQLLRLARGVVRHHRVRRVQDSLRRAVVLLQLDDLRLRIVPLEVQDVPYIRSAPASRLTDRRRQRHTSYGVRRRGC